MITSVAGRTKASRATGARVGGFGGAEGLADYLKSEAIAAVVDATHPFAGQMHRNAAEACSAAGVQLIRFERPGWREHQFADEWTWVASHEAAAKAAAGYNGTVLLTVGRQALSKYLSLDDVVARIAESDGTEYPGGWKILEKVGPFSLADELALLTETKAAVLISKDSGGEATAAKLDAAHQLNVPVIMIARPTLPEDVVQTSEPEKVLALLR